MKIYVLDTSTIIYHPFCYKSFKNNTVIIPIPVLEELDKLKSYQDETGKNARTFLRTLDGLIKNSKEEIHTGITIDDGIVLKIETDISMDESLGSPLYGDNRILSYMLHATKANQKVILVSKDIGLRVRARSYGVLAEDYIKDTYSLNDVPVNHKHLDLDDDEVSDYYMHNSLDVSDEEIERLQLKSNNFVSLRDSTGADITHTRYMSQTKTLKPLMRTKNLFGIGAKNLEQQFAIDLLLDNDVKLVVLSGPSGTGKAQPLDAKILTPIGWVNMGDLKVGNMVSTPDGSTANIIGVFPQGKLDIYKVSFNDGTSTECCANHLWLTETYLDRAANRKGTVKTTQEIKDTLLYKNKKVHSIPITKPIPYNKKSLIVDPYVFGCLLGDGTFRHNFGFSSADEYIVKTMSEELEKLHLSLEYKDRYDYKIIGLGSVIKNYKQVVAKSKGKIIKIYDNINDVLLDGYSKNVIYKSINKKPAYNLDWSYGKYHSSSPLLNYLKDNNLWMQDAMGKHIPSDYKFSSIEDRIALLQGLMDTDGSCSIDGTVEFSTSSPQLADDVKWLVQSLGGTVSMSERNTTYTYKNRIKTGKKSYRLYMKIPNDIMPFRLDRKNKNIQLRTKYPIRRFISNVEYIGKKEAQCILIDHPDHLYLTNDCIVTHNTLIALAAGLYNLMERSDHKYEKLIIMKPVVSVGKDIGALPGDKSEKLSPYLASYYDNINFLMKNSKPSKGAKNTTTTTMDPYLSLLMENGTIEIEAISYLRGRSLPNAFIIIDEIQNNSIHELKTILTRIGEGSKIVLLGDESQIDNMSLSIGSNALSTVINKFSDYPIAGSVSLITGERSELATLASEIL